MDTVLGSARTHPAAIAAALVMSIALLPGVGHGHAFPDHSDPRVGHTVDASPAEVRIWFDSAIEPAFSTLTVEDAKGKRVDRGDAHVDTKDEVLLEVSVPPLPTGPYQVVWRVITRDGHRTEGRFPFRVEAR